MISETRMDRENKLGRYAAVRPKRHNKIQSYLFWLPVPALWPRSCRINYPERAMQSRLSCSLPPLQTLLLSPTNCLRTLCTATRASRSATGAVINGTGPDGCLPELDMFPCCKSCVYGICAFVLRWFFSVLTLYSPMENSLGVKKISSCKCCIFLTFPVFLFCLPHCHMYVVYVWTGWWLISLVLVTSDNKGLLLLLLLE